MYKVEQATAADMAQITEFIKKIDSNSCPEISILMRAILVKDEGRVVGMVSYESHNSMGVIRYFLYDHCLAGTDLIVLMFFELYKNARQAGIKRLVATVSNDEVKALFAMLGFAGDEDNKSSMVIQLD